MALTIRPNASFGAYLVGVYLFSVPAFGYSDSQGLLFIPQITGAALLGYALFDILHGLRLTIAREIGLYGLFGLWAAVTYFMGPKTGPEGLYSLGTLVKVVLATLACAQLIKDEDDLYTALNIFVFSILLVFYQNAAELRYLRVASVISEEDRFAGTFANANTAAIFALTVIWASVLLFMRSRRGLLWKASYLIPVGFAVLIIYYSGSKKGMIGGGLLALLLARLFYLRQKASMLKKSLVILASSAMTILVGYYIYASPFFFRIQQMAAGGSDSDAKRFLMIKEALSVWLTNAQTFVMGVGYDNFRSYSSLQAYAHSTPFELLASNGLVGFVVFMSFLFLMFRMFIALYRKTVGRDAQSEFFVILAFLSIYAVFLLAAVLHSSRDLLPIMGCLAAFGHYRLRLLKPYGEAAGP